MTEVTIHEAKTHFSRLIREVEAGGEVIVKRGNTPVARLTPYADSEAPKPARTPGGLEGQIWEAPDAWDDDPEIERLFGMRD